MKGSLLRSGALRAIGRIGRRRLCTSQPGAAAAAARAELQDEARAALSTPAYARFGMDRFLFGEVLTHGSLAETLAHELGPCAVPAAPALRLASQRWQRGGEPFEIVFTSSCWASSRENIIFIDTQEIPRIWLA